MTAKAKIIDRIITKALRLDADQLEAVVAWVDALAAKNNRGDDNEIRLPAIPLDLYSQIADQIGEVRSMISRLEEIAEEVNLLDETLTDLGRTVFSKEQQETAPTELVDAFGGALSQATGHRELFEMMKLSLADISRSVL